MHWWQWSGPKSTHKSNGGIFGSWFLPQTYKTGNDKDSWQASVLGIIEDCMDEIHSDLWFAWSWRTRFFCWMCWSWYFMAIITGTWCDFLAYCVASWWFMQSLLRNSLFWHCLSIDCSFSLCWVSWTWMVISSALWSWLGFRNILILLSLLQCGWHLSHVCCVDISWHYLMVLASLFICQWSWHALFDDW